MPCLSFTSWSPRCVSESGRREDGKTLSRRICRDKVSTSSTSRAQTAGKGTGTRKEEGWRCRYAKMLCAAAGSIGSEGSVLREAEAALSLDVLSQSGPHPAPGSSLKHAGSKYLKLPPEAY
ncbi:hypothetical protein TARUN_7291 [Trichoderma arundinaceum]|uniref:Uncharacterized protein n=1 Tax=Trichoderma arundinaceum TaxID=490622 RepID=A0A395NG75_TRIAR|nr:hypothetical protein TARUN_7291 [Trichoderma arundinaceum]